MIFPTEIVSCGDYFCSECIEDHIGNTQSETCPVCSERIADYTLKTNFKMAKIIEKIINLFPKNISEYILKFSRRKAELLDRQVQLAELRTKYESIDHTPNDPFLVIFQAWTEFEKKKFTSGISKYSRGEPREYYCWIVRLARDWVIHHANHTDLSVAVHNLGLVGEEVPTAPLDADLMRQRLLKFIRF